MANRGYIDGIDTLIEKTSAVEVLQQFGQPPPDKAGGEHRMPCVFDPACAESSYGTMTINLDDPAKRIYCHACGVRGNLLTLLWGLQNGKPPSGGKLRGEEFKQAVSLLRELRGQQDAQTQPATPAAAAHTPNAPASVPSSVNVPLKDSENERARELVTLHEELIVDIDQMNPAAASYMRKRPWLTPEVARKWRMGYLPHSARGLLRGRMVYGYFDEHDDVLSYFGRDPSFEENWRKWEQRRRPAKGKPVKHRFVKGFQRGLELYGQHGKRLKEQPLRESLKRVGLVIVEGPNDVIRLDCLGIAAVGLCSNRATDTQVQKIARFARLAAGGKVMLMPDTDGEGEEGCKELLWNLHQQEGVVPSLAWTSTMDGGRWKNRQPESLVPEEWEELVGRLGQT